MSERATLPIDLLVHLEEYMGKPMALLDRFNKVLWGNHKIRTYFLTEEIVGQNIINLSHFFIQDESKLIHFLSGEFQDMELHGTVLSYEIKPGVFIHYKSIPNGYKLFWLSGLNNEGKLPYALDDLDYKRIVHQVFDAIIIYNSDGTIIEANKAVCEMYETLRGDFIGKNIFSLFPHQSLNDANNIWKKFIKTREIEGVYKYELENGGIKYIQFKGKADFAGGYHLGVLRDITQSFFADKALKKSELQLRTIFDSSVDQILLLDKDYKIITFNQPEYNDKGQERRFNFEMGEYVWKYFPKELKTTCFNFYSSFCDGKTLNTRLDLLLGVKQMQFDVSIVPALNDKGELKFMSLRLHDITEVMEAQLALVDSEKKFKSFTLNSPDLIYIIEVEKVEMIYFNRDVFLGHKTSGLKDHLGWVKIIFPQDISIVGDSWLNFIKGNSFETLEYRMYNADGSIEWVSNRFQVLETNELGAPKYLLATLTIITDRVIAIQSLAENQSNLNAVLENSEDLIWSMDSECRFTTCNSSTKHFFHAYTGRSPEIGKGLEGDVNVDFKTDFELCTRLALDGNKINREFVILTKNKSSFYEFRFNPIKVGGSKIAGVSIVARNVTARKNNEDELKKMNFELDSFVYRASHDLRAPLRSVLGLVMLIDKENDKEEIHKYVSMTEKSIQKLDTFILDLTNFSRNSRLDIVREEVNFDEILDDVLDNLQYMDNASVVKVERRLSNNLSFFSDPMRLSIILQNLISNAYKYANTYIANSYLIISIVKKENIIELSFEDNGIGINEVHLPQLFSMFFRASQLSYGSGLGLYITKQVVEKLSGVISVESVYNSGTTFIIKIPCN